MRAIIALYAFGLLIYPVWGLVSPESYRGVLDDFPQAEAAATAQLQLAAGVHWIKNAYLAFIFLLLARYLGDTGRSTDVRRGGGLMAALPVVLLTYQVLAQIAMSADPGELDLKLHIRGEWLLYFILGLALIGIGRTLKTESQEKDAGARGNDDGNFGNGMPQ